MTHANEIKVLFPQSGWKLVLTPHGSRVEIALYWGDKLTPTHVSAVDRSDLLDLAGT